MASCPRERVRREWKCPTLRRGPALLHAAHEPVLRRAAPSLGRPLSLCFPRVRPTPCRGGGSLSRRLPTQRLRRAATLEAGAAASERRSPSGGRHSSLKLGSLPAGARAWCPTSTCCQSTGLTPSPRSWASMLAFSSLPSRLIRSLAL